MTEQELWERIEALRKAIQKGRRDVALIAMTENQREAIEQNLDQISARLDRLREGLMRLREQA